MRPTATDPALITMLQHQTDVLQEQLEYFRNQKTIRELSDPVYDTGYFSNKLPAQVRTRMDIHDDLTVILTDNDIRLFKYSRTVYNKNALGTTTSKVITGTFRYWIEGLYHVVSIDGSLWNLAPKLESKLYQSFAANVPTLTSTTDGPKF